jgi:predicted transcriptional regulator
VESGFLAEWGRSWLRARGWCNWRVLDRGGRLGEGRPLEAQAQQTDPVVQVVHELVHSLLIAPDEFEGKTVSGVHGHILS